MVKTDEYTLVQNWLKMNGRMAKLVKEQQEQESRKLGDGVRIADLKAVWDNDQKRMGTDSTKPQGVRVADLKAVWNKEFKDKGGNDDV